MSAFSEEDLDTLTHDTDKIRDRYVQLEALVTEWGEVKGNPKTANQCREIRREILAELEEIGNRHRKLKSFIEAVTK